MYQQAIVTRLMELQDRLELVYGKRAIIQSVLFNLRGSKAGEASNRGVLRFNPVFAEHYTERFLARTVPHELAHVAAYQLFGTLAHDRYWRGVMLNLGADPVRLHTYPMDKIPGYEYKCRCSKCNAEYRLTRVRYFRAKNGTTTYACRSCNGQVVML